MNLNLHPTADVQTSNIGTDTLVWQYCVILSGAKIGNGCNINCHVFIENDVIIGNNVIIKPGVQVWDGLRIEDDVFIGPNVTFTNDLTPRSKQPPEEFVKTVIGKGASIGANTTLLAGIKVGEYAMIGAGSVVTKNILPYTLWYGNPASHRGYVTNEGITLTLNLVDTNGQRYELNDYKPIKIRKC